MKKVAALVLLLLLAYASAGEKQASEDDFLYLLHYETYDGVILVQCIDHLYTIVKAGNDFEMELAFVEETYGINTVLMCEASNIQGEPTFYPTNLDYVSGGYQYQVGYDEYSEVEGRTGKFRPDAAALFTLALPKVKRGESFTLYAGDDSVEINLKSLEELKSQ